MPLLFPEPQRILSARVSSEDDDAMDEDVPMDQDQPKAEGSNSKGDDLSQYNLDEYDNDEAMPGMFSNRNEAPPSMPNAVRPQSLA